jgi:hypothetical protein
MEHFLRHKTLKIRLYKYVSYYWAYDAWRETELQNL